MRSGKETERAVLDAALAYANASADAEHLRTHEPYPQQHWSATHAEIQTRLLPALLSAACAMSVRPTAPPKENGHG